MERLKIVLAVAAFLATGHTSPGHQVPVAASGYPTGATAQPSYVVIGDVQNFNYFPLSEKTTVRQAVINAGLLSDSVSVSVVRAAQDRALWTQMISVGSTDSGELVLNGDLLVVQSLAPIAGPFQRNAALRTDAGITVVALADEPIAAGDVLLQTNNRPSPEQRLSISCRFRGRTAVARAALTEEVAHGDVLKLSRATPSGLKGFGSLVPVVSEWQESASPTRLPQTIPVSDQVPQVGPLGYSDAHSHGFLMPMPAPSVESEDETSGAEILPSDPFADTHAANTVVADVDAPLSLRLVSQVSSGSDNDAPIVAPHPPTEYPELADTVDMASASAPMSPWNLFVIGGLLVAGTLILAASLKSDEEAEPDRLRIQGHQQAQTVTPVAADAVVNLPQLDTAAEPGSPLAPISRQTSETPTEVGFAGNVKLTPEAPPQETFQTNITPASLVAVQEWYGRDWLKTDPKPVTVNDIRSPASSELTSAINTLEEQRAGQGTTPFDSDRFAEVRPSTELVTVEQDVAEIPVDASDAPMKDFADLEDLLQNRLPIDLCTTRLPLRIALYGRPAGPRRLRIDAAHDTLAAPHMVRSAERIREKTGVAKDSASGAEDDGSEVSGSLNRALYQLHERTDHDLCD